MSIVQAARTSYEEYELRRQGHEQQQREAYELARWTVWHSYQLSPFLKPGSRPAAPADVWKFHWEQGAGKTRKLTRKDARLKDGEVEALNAIFKDFFKRKYSS